MHFVFFCFIIVTIQVSKTQSRSSLLINLNLLTTFFFVLTGLFHCLDIKIKYIWQSHIIILHWYSHIDFCLQKCMKSRKISRFCLILPFIQTSNCTILRAYVLQVSWFWLCNSKTGNLPLHELFWMHASIHLLTSLDSQTNSFFSRDVAMGVAGLRATVLLFLLLVFIAIEVKSKSIEARDSEEEQG